MARVFTREHLLNVSVNIIPLFIISFFLALFLIVQPWGFDVLDTTLMVGLHVVPLLSLAILSYLAVKHVEIDEPKEGIGEDQDYEGPTPEAAAERHREEEGAHAGENGEQT